MDLFRTAFVLCVSNRGFLSRSSLSDVVRFILISISRHQNVSSKAGIALVIICKYFIFCVVVSLTD